MTTTLIRRLEAAADELNDMCRYVDPDFFGELHVAETVEELSREAASLGAPIEEERVTLTPREGLVRIGRLLTWARSAPALEQKVDHLAGLVSKLLDRETMKEWYTVKEAAELTGFKEYTLRQCCNLGRIREEWRQKDRGERWRIHRDAVEDIRNNGLPAK